MTRGSLSFEGEPLIQGTISGTNEWESLSQCGGFSERQIGMETLCIHWAKEEVKMAKIARNIHLYC